MLQHTVVQGCPTYSPRANVRPTTRFYVARKPVYNQLTRTNVISVRERVGDELYYNHVNMAMLCVRLF